MARVRIRLTRLLEEAGWSQLDLHHATGIRKETISHYCTGFATAIQQEHILKIMLVLELRDFNELFELEDDETQARRDAYTEAMNRKKKSIRARKPLEEAEQKEETEDAEEGK